ncbi:MAG: glycerophosphodiester phosphodiesterase family protein [Cyclobacteriaceae bacterium]
MKLPRLLLYSLPIFALLLAVWLLEPVIYYYFVPIEEKIEVDGSQIEKVKVIAHRGASGYAPENTIAAIEKALELGADIIEIDVHLSGDGELIVIHDELLERTTDGEGPVHVKALADLKKLDAGSWFGNIFKGETVPTLDEVLGAIDGKAICLIEIKWAEAFLYEGIVPKIHQSISRNRAEDWVMIQSFEAAYLDESHTLNPAIPVQKLIVFEESAPLISFHLDNEFHLGKVEVKPFYEGVNPFYLSMTQRRVAGLHTQGKTVYTYTVNDTEDMKKLLVMGVDGIITNFPDRLIKLKSGWLNRR